MIYVLSIALMLSHAFAATAQQQNMSGTWEITQAPRPIQFDRLRTGTPPPCDPDEAQVRLLGMLSEPAGRVTLTQTGSTLVMKTDSMTTTFQTDGRQQSVTAGPFTAGVRASFTNGAALRLEWTPSFGGRIVETYTVADGPLLLLEQTIEHKALSRPARQSVSYRRAADAQRQDSPARPAAEVGQVADTSFRPPIDDPAHALGTGPAILIDEAHNNFHTSTGRYLPFAELLRRDGFVVNPLTERITGDALRSVKVLVSANANAAFTLPEVTAVRNWVNAGGSLFLIVDHPPFVEASAGLASTFGIRLRNEGVGGRLFFRRSDGTLKDHPITAGIDQIVTFTGSYFDLERSGQPLLVFGPQVCSGDLDPNPISLAGHLQGAVLRFGAGRIAVFAEAAMFSAQVTGPNRSPMGMNAPVAKQNLQLLRNVVRWLTSETQPAVR